MGQDHVDAGRHHLGIAAAGGGSPGPHPLVVLAEVARGEQEEGAGLGVGGAAQAHQDVATDGELVPEEVVGPTPRRHQAQAADGVGMVEGHQLADGAAGR